MANSHTYLSPHFTLEEFLYSETAERLGIDNRPSNPDIFITLKRTALNMELIRAALKNNPIMVTSAFRCIRVNRLIGSKDTSQHIKGEAVDFKCQSFGSPFEICEQILKYNISFDQLILEHSWVHISFKSPASLNRKQVLSLLANKHYALGLTDKFGRKLT